MNVKKAGTALKQVALKEGVSVDTVRHEIGIAIAAAAKSSDPEARAFWMSIPHKEARPTPEEAIAYIADMATKL